MAQVVYINLADSGTVLASTWSASTPPARLQNPHVKRRWMGRNGDTEYITFDLGAAQTIDTVALFGLAKIDADDNLVNMSDSTIRQVRLSLTDPNLGDVYDSGSAAGFIKEAYGSMIELISPVSARYGRIDLSDAGAQALLAGRLVVGLRSTYTLNFAYGWGEGFGDTSRMKKSAGNSTFIDEDDTYRIITVSFDALDAADRDSFLRDMLRRNGRKRDILFVTDPDADDVTEASIWGLVPDLQLITQPNLAFFAHALTIEERF